MKRLVCLCFAGLAACAVARPAIWWASYPAKPGEHVLLSGGGWTTNAVVRFGDRTLRPVRRSETGLVVEWPESLTAARPEVRVADETGESDALVLNRPTVSWTQGDAFDRSTPGGTVRLFGRSLDRGDVALVAADGSRVSLPVLARDVWNVAARIPPTAPVGAHAVEVDGVRVAEVWPVRAAERPYGTNVFRVVDFGAVADDGRSDDRAVHAALDAARRAGGGVVAFPRGRIEVHSTLAVPPHTLLKGVDRDVSGLYWQDFFNPPDRLVTGGSHFGLEDLFLSCGNMRCGIKADLWSHDIALKRLRIRFIGNQWSDSNREDYWRRYSERGGDISLFETFRVTLEDVDAYADKNGQGGSSLDSEWVGPRVHIAGGDVILRRCSFRGSGYTLLAAERLVSELNEFVSTVSVAPGTRDMFWSSNRHADRYAGDREAITHDLRLNAFGDTLVTARVEGTRVRFDLAPLARPMKPRHPYHDAKQLLADWVGGDVQIVGGRGLGQTRRVVRMRAKDDCEIDRPFDLKPDETSRFVLTVVRSGLHYVNNVIADAQVAIQLYGGASDCVVAGNRSIHGGGFYGFGIRGKGGFMCAYDCQFLDNVVVSPLKAFRSEEYRTVIGSPGVSRWRGTSACPARGFVARRNRIEGGWLEFGCPDVVAEGNAVLHAPYGVVETAFSESHYVGGNVFTEVPRPSAMAVASAPALPHLEATLAWTNGVALLEVKGSAALPVRYWCEDRAATVLFDGTVVRAPGWDGRQRPTYLFAPGSHTLEVRPATSARRLRLLKAD